MAADEMIVLAPGSTISRADLVNQVERERAAQGLPPHLEDPTALAAVARLMRTVLDAAPPTCRRVPRAAREPDADPAGRSPGERTSR